MSKTHETSRSGETTASKMRSTRWQPSTLDTSSPTYSGAMTGQRPTAPGRVARQKSSLRRVLAFAAGGVGLLVVGLIFLRLSDDLMPTAPPPVVQESVAILELVRGSASLLAAEGPSRLLSLESRESIPAGTVIETQARISGFALAANQDPAPGRVAFRLAGGSSVRLDADSRVRVASRDTLELERGALYVDSAAGSGVEVRTTLGVVRDIGTQFEVRLASEHETDAPLLVRVREGMIHLEREGEETHEAGRGSELRLRGDGAVERAEVSIYGPQWDWVLETAPAPEVEGQSLRAFLDWLVREGGWTLRFADQETEAQAAETVLHGSIAGLAPLEAATVVFKGSGLSFESQEDVLWIASIR